MPPMPALVSTEWLSSRLASSDVRVLDGSWYLPQSGRNAALEYAAAHIPGAAFFDIDAISDHSTSLPHMLPSAEAFSEEAAALGINDWSEVIVYDGSGVNLSAPRVWWTFQVFGHSRVAMLDGGLGKWRDEGRPLEAGIVKPAKGKFTSRFNAGLVRDLAAIRDNLCQQTEQVVDLRSRGRYAGTEPEPRPGLRGGHIPGSLNLPFTDLVGPDGTVLPLTALRCRIEAAGIDLTRPIVATCGSGASACALALSLDLIGHRAYAVYDGSWAEWGGRGDTPVETEDRS